MCRIVPTLSYFYFFLNNRFARTSNALGNTFRHVAKASNHSGNDFRHARKCQTIRETTFARRGNAKPLGKWLSPGAEMLNCSEKDFLPARQCRYAWYTRHLALQLSMGWHRWLRFRLMSSPCARHRHRTNSCSQIRFQNFLYLQLSYLHNIIVVIAYYAFLL